MIRENQATRDALLARARDFLSRPRGGIHVSDLLFPRRAYFRAKHPELALTDEEVGLFAAGRGHHGILEALTTTPEYREVEVEFEGIRGRIDVYQDIPLEIKTTRLQRVLLPEEIRRDHPSWIEQLSYYCAMVGSNLGRLAVFYLNIPEGERLVPKLQVYDCEFEGLGAIRDQMVERRLNLELAISEGDFTFLPKCPSWMCDRCAFGGECCP